MNLRALAQFTIAAGFAYGAYLIFRPFLLPIVTALIITLVLRPFYRKLPFRSPAVKALLCILLVAIAIILPVSILSLSIVKEVSTVRGSIDTSQFDLNHLNTIVNKIANKFGIGAFANIDLNSSAKNVLDSLAGKSLGLLGGVFGVLGEFVITLFGLFYFLESSDKSRGYLHRLSPLSHEDTDRLVDRAESVVQSTIQGNLILVLLQGALFTVAALAFHFKAPLLIGIFYGLTSMVPAIGSSLVWVPLVIYSLLTGHTTSAIGIAACALAQVAIIDHLIGPKLIGSRSQLNPFLTLLGILGGIERFGLLGFILGPTIVALGVVGLEMLSKSWKPER